MPTVHTVFGDQEVPEDEAAALKAQGLALDAAPSPEPAPEDIEVLTVFSELPMRMPAAEAKALDAQGLLVHDDTPADQPAKPRRDSGKKEQ
jgi:hypothetical protein